MQYLWGCQQSKLPITNFTQFVYNVGPARIEGNIWTCYETGTISTEVMILIVVSCCFESNGSIAWPSHQSTAINKDGIWLKSICDKDSLECIILKILCSCITIVVRLIQAYLNNSQIIFSYSGYLKIIFNEFACVEIRRLKTYCYRRRLCLHNVHSYEFQYPYVCKKAVLYQLQYNEGHPAIYVQNHSQIYVIIM